MKRKGRAAKRNRPKEKEKPGATIKVESWFDDCPNDHRIDT